MKNWFDLICIMTILLLSHQITGECMITQETLTFGDRYSNVTSNHLLTLGFVTDSDCIFTPSLLITDMSGLLVQISKPSRSNIYRYQDETMDYSKTAHFFFINSTHIKFGKATKYALKIADISSKEIIYTLPKKTVSDSYSLFWIADMDISDNSTYTRTKLNKTDLTNYDFLMHSGDFAYDINDKQGMQGDNYFENLKNINTQIPYVITPGNHENFDNGNFFNYRLRMPVGDEELYDKTSNHYYSLSIGPAKFFFINYDYILNMNISTAAWTYVFTSLQHDLMLASANPDIKWKVIVTHRPIYCSDEGTTDCITNFWYLHRFEALYKKFNISVLLESHEHFYERVEPISNFKIYEPVKGYYKSSSAIIDQPGRFEQIILGCAGTLEFFPHEISDYPLNSKLVAGTQCYGEINFDENSFRVRVSKSINDELIDLAIIVKDLGDRNSVLFYIGLAFATVAFMLLYILLASRRKYKIHEKEIEYRKATPLI